ncbi:MAG: transcriptional regulator [Segetibacter sp.]|jgi:DNA-binding response OmpR family regulator|nr:transcriptional regulator [Segetibacter sp.]
MKVLFVQEKPFLSTALRLTLSSIGYDLIFSNTTSQPLSIIEEVNPQIIITDITEAIGINYLVEAKKKNMPVIVLSENGQEDELQKAFNMGADDYMCAPLSIQELALRVSLLTRTKVQTAA